MCIKYLAQHLESRISLVTGRSLSGWKPNKSSQFNKLFLSTCSVAESFTSGLIARSLREQVTECA